MAKSTVLTEQFMTMFFCSLASLLVTLATQCMRAVSIPVDTPSQSLVDDNDESYNL